MTHLRRSFFITKYLKPWVLRLTGKAGWATTLHALPGGIAPASHKALSLQQKIIRMPSGELGLPAQLILPLRQHLGPDSALVVSVGDYVYKNQLIAAANGEKGVGLHAPSSGYISSINYALLPMNEAHDPERSWQQALNRHQTAIVIDTDGKHAVQPGLLAANCDWRVRSPDELRQAVFDAGICGMGGAGFPTAIKLGASAIKTLIINGAECEPFITADEALMREHAAEVIEGALIIQRICGAQSCVIGIEADKYQAIDAIQGVINQIMSELQPANAGQAGLSLTLIPPIYPSGGEKQLIRIMTGIQVASGKRPVEVGVLCHSVATARAVYKAVSAGEPLTSRITTLTGHALKTAVNVEVMIGTPVSHLLDFAGVQHAQLQRVLVGGPLMGYEASDLDTPVLKTSNCLLAGSELDIAPAVTQSKPHRDCIRCDFCATVCPVKLQPQTLYFAARHQHHDASVENGLFDCIECGACAVVCPSHIPLVNYYREEKAVIRTGNDTAQQAYWQSLFEKHQQRLSVNAIDQQQRKLDKLQHKLEAIAVGEPLTKTALTKTPVPPVVAPTASKSTEQIKQEIEAAVARTRAKKAELQKKNDATQDADK
ncbi:MAG: electron transport complex subunit RsxC [Pseudohongiella sp.]|nr:electron transport complex subunit RsxC [Pseudohongiella sp.]